MLLVRRGERRQAHLRREMITREVLMAALHRAGLRALDQVDSARRESDGRITVVPKD